jgi:uncharacterized protein involved in exopolysaccharide biosynthesis
MMHPANTIDPMSTTVPAQDAIRFPEALGVLWRARLLILLVTATLTVAAGVASLLNDQVPKTSVVQVQQAIYSLPQGEIKRTMLARGSDEYALRVVSNRLLWVFGGFVSGLFISTLLAFARFAWSGL